MKKLITALFFLAMAACTLSGNNTTTSVPTATLLVSSDVPVSVTPIPPTAVTDSSPSSTTVSSPTLTAVSSPTSTQVAKSYPWWDDTVFYEIFVRSFFDSNSDGIGDFNGLIEKLDYLNDGDPNTSTDLGISGIWLMPIHPSPSTHGYDVTDYYAVNPQYGTMDDFRRLVDEAHRRSIRVIIDLVLNHTSNQHPWFIQSQDPQSSYRDWYIWVNVNPGFTGQWNQQVWHELNGEYYYGFFWEGMPDLNFTNLDVTKEMENVTKFWLDDVGIDGFRLDAIGSLIERGQTTVETKDTHDWLKNYFTFYKDLKRDAMTIGEVWREDAIVIPYVANREVDLAFEFDLSAAMLASINDGNSAPMIETLGSSTSQLPDGQYGSFLTNHDMARVMTQLGNNLEKAKAAASLYFSIPGVPFMYYGEEIGMVGDAPDEMSRRPMQWSGEQFAGFSRTTPWKIPDTNYVTLNVSSENSDPNSLLSHYRTLITLRNSHPALRTGELIMLSASNSGLFACLRTTSDESVLVIVNLTSKPIRDYELSLTTSTLPQGALTPVSMLGETSLATLTVLDDGRIWNYIPVSEIQPYTTIMMLLNSK